jgi:hypothetical protein
LVEAPPVKRSSSRPMNSSSKRRINWSPVWMAPPAYMTNAARLGATINTRTSPWLHVAKALEHHSVARLLVDSAKLMVQAVTGMSVHRARTAGQPTRFACWSPSWCAGA